MPKKNTKTAFEYYQECKEGKRKSVPAKVFSEVSAVAQTLSDRIDELEFLEKAETITLRDRFALAALTAMGAVVVAGEYGDTARVAYAIADEMMAAR